MNMLSWFVFAVGVGSALGWLSAAHGKGLSS